MAEKDEANVESMDDKEIKQWLYRSLMHEISTIGLQLGFEADKKLIETIANTEDRKEKSRVQLEYIYSCNEQFKEIAKTDMPGKNSSRWDTMPLTMRENKSFNCVGASLLGHDLLRKCEIENFFGNPAGHVMNVVRLDNNDLWYVDFRNDRIEKMQPEIIEINGIKSVNLINTSNVYNYVPLLEVTEAPAFIFGNIRALKSEATNDEYLDDFPGKDDAKKIYQRFKKELDEISPGKFRQFLYSETDSLWSGDQMQNERERVTRFYSLCRNLFSPLNPEIRKAISEEIQTKKVLVRQFFDENTSGDGMSVDMKNVLSLYRQKLNEIKQNDPALYNEFYDTIISIILNEK
ncbi:MAG: hypothetical protein PHW24_01690 [Candidatus Moranbacteria bacterium]|nr:hypothetical protein [Candidatus Moranbacteria bacterium]